MEFLKIWRIIVRRKWTIIVTFFAFLAIVVIGSYIVKPIYAGKAKVLIESTDTLSSLMSILGLTTQGASLSTTYEEAHETDIALTTISPILEKLISNLNLKDRKGEALKSEALIKSSILNKILPQPYIEVEQYEDADILLITSNSTSRQEAAKMSNELARLYIEDRLAKIRENYTTTRLLLENQIKDVKEKYYESLSEKRDFMIKEETVDLSTETSNLLKYILDLKNEYKDNEIAIAQASENIAFIQKKFEGKEYASDVLINQLESKLNDLLVDIAGKKIDFTEEHPDILQINRQIDTIKNILKDRADIILSSEKVPIAPIYGDLIKSLKDAYINKGICGIKGDLLKRYIENSQDDLIKIPPKKMKLSEIDLSLSVHEDIYKSLLQYLTQVGIAESMTLSNIRLVEPAAEPVKPDFPNKTLNCILGVILGLFWGFSLAFFMEYIDNTIKSHEDIKRIKSLTLLGTVPRAKQLKKMRTIANLDPTSHIVEAYRTIKNSIKYTSTDKPIKSLVITSSINLEGKSSTTLNIAITFSMEGKKIIVVDLDLRRPAINKFFNITTDNGVTNVLAEGLQLEKAIVHSGIRGLDLLLSGPVPPDPNKLIESQKIKDIINTLKGMYDMVIIDTPPVMLVNDAIVLGNIVDGVLYVIESERATFQMVEHVKENIDKAGINLIGVVLNKFKAHRMG